MASAHAVQQTLLLVVDQLTAITSADSTTFAPGYPAPSPSRPPAYPTPTVSESGTLPAGVTFDSGTDVLSGTPATTDLGGAIR